MATPLMVAEQRVLPHPRRARGDERAFAQFYREHLDAVVAFLRRRVPEPELAFDLAADTFAAVAMSAGTYNGDGPPAAWL